MRAVIPVIAIAIVSLAPSVSVSGMMSRIKTVGDWQIYRSEDPMTDRIDCVALYHGVDVVELSRDNISVDLKHRGSVDGYRFRLDDGPPSEWISATQVERDIGALVMKDENFDAMKSSKRIRFQILTILSDEVDEDVDLSALPEVESVLNSTECSG